MDERIKRRISLHDINVLMSVIEAGSMGRAARRLNTSQPAISRSVADLENAVGVRLLDRTPHGVQPTPYGRALLGRGVAVFDELAQGIKDIEYLKDPTRGELVIGASIAVAGSLVSSVMDRLCRKYPGLNFQVLATDSATAFDALLERRVELAVLHLVEPIAREDLDVRLLLHDPHVVVAEAQSRWTRRQRLRLTDLMEEPWVLPIKGSPYWSVISEAFRSAGLGVPQSVVSSTLPVRNAMLSTGQFLSMVPRVVLQFPARQSIRALPIDLPTTRRPLAIITLRSRTLTPLAQLFADCAYEMANQVNSKPKGRSRTKR